MESEGGGEKGRIHFVGIGGVSMSAIAAFCKAAGYEVSGSDLCESAFTNELRRQGVTVNIGHSADNAEGCLAVVKNAAIGADNPEIAAAAGLGIPIRERAEVLGKIANGYEACIAVSGTHGKTTCSGMLANIFISAGLEPSVHIGGIMINLGSQYRLSEGRKYFITEACEYKKSFLHLFPDTAVILNVAMDHPDCYKDINDVAAAFVKFLSNIKSGGAAVLNGDDLLLRGMSAAHPCKTSYFGFKKHNAYRAVNIKRFGGRYGFDLIEDGKKLCFITLRVLGRHNIYNALAAAAVARRYGISADKIKSGLDGFAGMKRRFEYWGNFQGAESYHDYAHHPQEITAVLKTAYSMLNAQRSMPGGGKNNKGKIRNKKEERNAGGRIICVFQPHTYSRTRRLFKRFAKALCSADIVIIAGIYAAREKPLPGVTSGALAETVNMLRGETAAYACLDFKGVSEKIKEFARAGDAVLVLGAGDIEQLKNLLF